MSLTPLHHTTPAHPDAEMMRRVQAVATAVTTDGRGLLPAQLRVAELLTAKLSDGRPEHPFVALSVPRRSGKTTVMLTVALTRMLTEPRLKVAFTAQTLLKARDRFLDLGAQLDACGLPGYVVRLAQGSERITLANGSVLSLLSPKADAFRSAAFDLILLDESQEHDGDARTDLLAGVLPTLDTRPAAQLVVAGTAGPRRDSLLWDALEWGREGRWAIVEYAAAEGADLDDEAVWYATHPGLAEGLTTVDRIRANRDALGREQFGREYLGLWPEDAAQAGLSADVWDRQGTPHVDLPSEFTCAFDVAPGGDRASVSAAYRDAEGRLRVEVMDSRPGTEWLVPYLVKVSEKHRVPIGYDAAGKGALAVADSLSRQRMRSKLVGLTTTDYLIACQRFTSAVIEGDLWHARQPDLTAAVNGAARRAIGDAGYGWGRRLSSADITPLVSATVALHLFATMNVKRSHTIVAA